ncbi:hypothetical protein [Desulfuromonas thiophila]|uniref:hypothetical protein n=1 Tax=Desulfuromonas thiophila TaxID=57664 RepID=UPI0029F54EA9|nr:hypothetical protein [Desulfuromonas thiophila]
MIDLTSKKMLSGLLNPIIDAALEAERDQQEARRYLGGSRLGVECERQLQYEVFATPKDPEKDFPGRILRVFERGHWAEAALVRWLELAGVTILTEDEGGGQFGFSDFDGLFQGHCDGILTGGPESFGPFPRLWENKCIKADDWRALSSHGLRKEKPVYWAQCQVYMDRFGLAENPALFSAVNANTMGIYWEAVPYNPQAVAALDAKAARILQACLAGEQLPRLSQDPNFYQCKWCSWRKRCHGLA